VQRVIEIACRICIGCYVELAEVGIFGMPCTNSSALWNKIKIKIKKIKKNKAQVVDPTVVQDVE